MTDAKPRKAQRVALGTALCVLAWLLGVWPPPVWWRDHWPRETAMMRREPTERGKDGKGMAHDRSEIPPYHPTRLGEISPILQRMVVIAEDSRFWAHHGIDPSEVADALGVKVPRRGGHDFSKTVRNVWERRDRLRGASTITQQLAKNLYLSPSRNPLRKIKEAVTAVRVEFALPKSRILELYLAVAEWGPGLWGADAASHAYFRVPPARLDELQAAALAATLPNPRSSNPRYHPARMLARRDLILARYHGQEGDTALGDSTRDETDSSEGDAESPRRQVDVSDKAETNPLDSTLKSTQRLGDSASP